MKKFVAMLILSAMCFGSKDLFAQKVSAKVYEGEYTGYLQSPAPGEDYNTLILWKNPLKEGQTTGFKITLSDAVLDSLGGLDDLQGKKITLVGTFQRFPDGLTFCLRVELVDHERLAEEAGRVEQLFLLVEGYLEINKNSLLVYKFSTGEDPLDEIKFDDKTLFLNTPYGWPRERIHQLSLGKKVRIKVGWRQTDTQATTAQPPNDYIADYINLTVLSKPSHP